MSGRPSLQVALHLSVHSVLHPEMSGLLENTVLRSGPGRYKPLYVCASIGIFARV